MRPPSRPPSAVVFHAMRQSGSYSMTVLLVRYGRNSVSLRPRMAIPNFEPMAPVTAATKVLTGIFAARRDGVARRVQLRAGTALIARGEFSLIITGLVGTSVPTLAPLATAYVFAMAIAGPVLARYPGGPALSG